MFNSNLNVLVLLAVNISKQNLYSFVDDQIYYDRLKFHTKKRQLVISLYVRFNFKYDYQSDNDT